MCRTIKLQLLQWLSVSGATASSPHTLSGRAQGELCILPYNYTGFSLYNDP
jgi:hypothetical protein